MATHQGMTEKIGRLFAVSVLLMAAHASAETASENVTVTATKSREVLGKFTKTFAIPAKITGKIARWQRRLCPVVVGQNSQLRRIHHATGKVLSRWRQAHSVNTEASCKPNIEIVFTTMPQALLDTVRKNDPVLSGLCHIHRRQQVASGNGHKAHPGLVHHRNRGFDRRALCWTKRPAFGRGGGGGGGGKKGIEVFLKKLATPSAMICCRNITRSNGNHINDGVY